MKEDYYYSVPEIIDWAGSEKKLQALMYPYNPLGSNVRVAKNRGGFSRPQFDILARISKGKFHHTNIRLAP